MGLPGDLGSTSRSLELTLSWTLDVVPLLVNRFEIQLLITLDSIP